MVTLDIMSFWREICFIVLITRPLSQEEAMGFTQKDVSM